MTHLYICALVRPYLLYGRFRPPAIIPKPGLPLPVCPRRHYAALITPPPMRKSTSTGFRAHRAAGSGNKTDERTKLTAFAHEMSLDMESIRLASRTRTQPGRDSTGAARAGGLRRRPASAGKRPPGKANPWERSGRGKENEAASKVAAGAFVLTGTQPRGCTIFAAAAAPSAAPTPQRACEPEGVVQYAERAAARLGTTLGIQQGQQHPRYATDRPVEAAASMAASRASSTSTSSTSSQRSSARVAARERAIHSLMEQVGRHRLRTGKDNSAVQLPLTAAFAPPALHAPPRPRERWRAGRGRSDGRARCVRVRAVGGAATTFDPLPLIWSSAMGGSAAQ